MYHCYNFEQLPTYVCIYICMCIYIYIVVHVYHMCIVVHVYYMLYIHICIFLYYYYMIPAMLHPRHLLGIILATTSIHLHGWRGLTEHVHIFNVYIYMLYDLTAIQHMPRVSSGLADDPGCQKAYVSSWSYVCGLASFGSCFLVFARGMAVVEAKCCWDPCLGL